MKILFICGSLEPGRDGVGDYTRRLAGECIRRGVGCRIIALNDRKLQVHGPVFDRQQDDETDVECLRLCPRLTWRQRVDVARRWCQSYNPDMLSLQYVPFSFHKKGIPFWLSRRLHQLGRGITWHIMFHELWADTRRIGSPLPLLQKQIVHSLQKLLEPTCVHTSNESYRRRLKTFDAEILPLFGNIEIQSAGNSDMAQATNRIRAIAFGTLSDDLLGFAEQLEWLSRTAERISKSVEVIFAGRSVDRNRHYKIVEKILGEEAVTELGPQEADHLSCLIASCDVGISRSSAYLFPKSGTTISLLEHGLPVVLRGPRLLTADLVNSRFRQQLIFGDDCEYLPPKSNPRSTLPDCACLFLKSIQGR